MSPPLSTPASRRSRHGSRCSPTAQQRWRRPTTTSPPRCSSGLTRRVSSSGRSISLAPPRLRRTATTSASDGSLPAAPDRARDTFHQLGAQPWMRSRRRELRATGLATGPTDPTGAASLTPQELQIAQLAAEGLTNKEIGARLFLSHRTVSTHLYQLFPKLGITSRAALRDALGDLSKERWPREVPGRTTGRSARSGRDSVCTAIRTEAPVFTVRAGRPRRKGTFALVGFAVSPDAYDRFMGRYPVPLAPVFVNFVGVEPGQRAVDVGCGPGALTAELVRGWALIRSPVDPSAPFVEAVRERHPRGQVHRAAPSSSAAGQHLRRCTRPAGRALHDRSGRWTSRDESCRQARRRCGGACLGLRRGRESA